MCLIAMKNKISSSTKNNDLVSFYLPVPFLRILNSESIDFRLISEVDYYH